ncbi:glycosyltransferase [Candidatus Daviesbacteria bacterium]|nr:glycosyltransferase [Candidatus Daviesbacteria bacterium]
MVKTVMIVAKKLIYGGTEKYTLNLANFLAKKGINVIVITSGGPLVEHFSEKVKVFIIPALIIPRFKEIVERKILHIAKEYKPQIMHVYSTGQY